MKELPIYPLIHSLSLQKKKERDKRPCNLLMKQSNLSRRTARKCQPQSVLPSLSLPLLPLIQGYKFLFVTSYEICIVLCRWQNKAHKICFIRWGTNIKRLKSSGFEHQPIFSVKMAGGQCLGTLKPGTNRLNERISYWFHSNLEGNWLF